MSATRTPTAPTVRLACGPWRYRSGRRSRPAHRPCGSTPHTTCDRIGIRQVDGPRPERRWTRRSANPGTAPGLRAALPPAVGHHGSGPHRGRGLDRRLQSTTDAHSALQMSSPIDFELGAAGGRTCIPTRHGAAVLVGAKAKPSGWPSPSLDPDYGRRRSVTAGSRPFQDQKPRRQVSTDLTGLPLVAGIMLVMIPSLFASDRY